MINYAPQHTELCRQTAYDIGDVVELQTAVEAIGAKYTKAVHPELAELAINTAIADAITAAGALQLFVVDEGEAWCGLVWFDRLRDLDHDGLPAAIYQAALCKAHPSIADAKEALPVHRVVASWLHQNNLCRPLHESAQR